MLTIQQCCWAKLILWLTDKPRLLLFCFSVLFHMYEALKQTQNKTILFRFGFVLRCFVSVVRPTLQQGSPPLKPSLSYSSPSSHWPTFNTWACVHLMRCKAALTHEQLWDRDILHCNIQKVHKTNIRPTDSNLLTHVRNQLVLTRHEKAYENKQTFMLTSSSPRYNVKPMRCGKLVTDRTVCR